ncbi:VTT domain-containing protein [Brachymonas sp.]|uniref:VTT domain-containing protein n=1 Tax=Brachymonas sp. TaxID=1936292 RepID=UPI0035B343C2
MDVAALIDALHRHAAYVVFLNVLLQQIGLPVPAVPTLLLAGSLVVAPSQMAGMLVAAICASVLADWVWYGAGRVFGYRVLSGLCKLSINPGSCVNQTEHRFMRWGVKSLVVAKFVPGFSTVAPPIAGALRMPLSSFVLAAACGAALWAGLALCAGWLMHDQVRQVIALLSARTGGLLWFVLAIAALWLGWKLWQKYRFHRLCAVPHITPDELIAAMKMPTPPLLLDLRGPLMIQATGVVPGAVVADQDHLERAVAGWPREAEIVTLCACPEDAGAVEAAHRLREAGYPHARPLQGGYDAWVAAHSPAPASAPAAVSAAAAEAALAPQTAVATGGSAGSSQRVASKER